MTDSGIENRHRQPSEIFPSVCQSNIRKVKIVLTPRIIPAIITFLLTLLIMAILSPAYAQGSIKLRGQSDPFSGDNRYGDVWGEGNYAYLGSYNGTGVMIFDISDPSNPRLVGQYNSGETGRFQDVVVSNGIGYFGSESRGGLHIVDVRNPASPVLLSQINDTNGGFQNVHELFVSNGVLYTCDSRTNRIKIYDVTKPEAPRLLHDVTTTDNRFIHAITVVNGRLFTSGWGGKTDIYDVRNVLNETPKLLGAVNSGTTSHAAWMSNDGKIMVSARETAYGDVRLFDISNPASPIQLASITAQSLGLEAFSAHNPYIVGNMLFVSWYQAGVVAIDITDPRQPKLAGVYDTHNNGINGFDGCWGVFPFLGLDRILVSDLDGGLLVVDASAALAGPRTVSAASYSFSAIAPKSIVAAFGPDLSLSTDVATTLPLPTVLNGTSISILDVQGKTRKAPLFFVSPNQVNYQIPTGTAPGPAIVKITNGAGQTTTGTTIITEAAPSIFTADQSGSGFAIALDAYTFSFGPFAATRPNGQPNAIALFGTGLGEDATDIDSDVSRGVQALIDGQPANVIYAGRVPGLQGLNQVNIVFPSGVSSGQHKLTIIRGGVASNTVLIDVM